MQKTDRCDDSQQIPFKRRSASRLLQRFLFCSYALFKEGSASYWSEFPFDLCQKIPTESLQLMLTAPFWRICDRPTREDQPASEANLRRKNSDLDSSVANPADDAVPALAQPSAEGLGWLR